MLAGLTHHTPGVVLDSTAVRDLGPGPILVLGNMIDSQLARKLYFEAYDFTDAAWPGRGGHAVRTIRDPLATGAHVVILGGSDAAGVADAAVRAGRPGPPQRQRAGLRQPRETGSFGPLDRTLHGCPAGRR